MSRSTIALQMLVKDEVAEVVELVKQAYPYFDQIILTVSDEQAKNKLVLRLAKHGKCIIRYRKWNDRFDEARNANYSLGDTTYCFWLDADDSFDFSAIPKLVSLAETEGLDAIYLPYNYAQDENGNCITRHWRERLTRRSHPFEWRGWVHETQISDVPFKHKRVDIEIKHKFSNHAASTERNHEILKKGWEETSDPRYLHYLGMSYFTRGQYKDAIAALDDYLKIGGSDSDIYRSLNLMSEAYYYIDKPDKALDYAARAAVMQPEYPQAFWLLAQFEADQDNYKEALEWVKVSHTKSDPDNMSIWDPSARERAIFIAARCAFMLGRFNEALSWLRKVADSEQARDFMDDFLNAADTETFIQLLPRFQKFFKSDKDLFNALRYDLQYDGRVTPLREKVIEPKTWGEKSVVIFCGKGYEEWGPHTLDKGMGGSEEAVVYLARELARLDWHVTVFGEVEEGYLDEEFFETQEEPCPVPEYKPWREFDRRDKFNVCVVWRAPQYADAIKAKVKIIDLHDILPESLVKDRDGTYFVKSEWQRNLYPKLPDEKFKVIGNGIKKEQFK